MMLSEGVLAGGSLAMMRSVSTVLASGSISGVHNAAAVYMTRGASSTVKHAPEIPRVLDAGALKAVAASSRLYQRANLAKLSRNILAAVFPSPTRSLSTLTSYPTSANGTSPLSTTTTTTIATSATTSCFHQVLNNQPPLQHGCISVPQTNEPQALMSSIMECLDKGVRDHDVLKQLAEAVASQLDQLTAAQLSDLAVAFAQTGCTNIKFQSMLVDQIVCRMTEFTPSQLANTMWAFGELQYYNNILLEPLMSFVVDNIGQFTATDLAKVVWAYGRVGYRGNQLSDIMQQMVSKLDEDFCPKAMAEVVFSEALMHWVPDPEVQQAIADHTINNIQEYDGESLGKILYGLATSGCEEGALYCAAAGRTVEIMDQLSPRDLARIMWALSENSCFHQPLLNKLTEETLPLNMHKFEQDELRILITACNKLGCSGDSVARAALLLQKMQNGMEFSLSPAQS